ncbi:MAG: cbb3-type cytochrome c oxidase subunit 3 [Rhodoferax sp.]
MNPIWGPIAGAFIVLMMLAFIGIWIWAWLPYHRQTFGELARLPLDDDDGGEQNTTTTRGERA